MKRRKRTIRNCVFVGCLVAMFLGVGNTWYSKQQRHTAQVEISKLGGTYTLANAQRIRDTGEKTNVISRFLINPVTEVDLSVAAWPRNEPGMQSRFALVSDNEIEVLELTPRLRRLSLRGMPITDASIETLARLTRLRHLDISGTRISANATEQLEVLLPDCEIHK